jgi:hypothetical protein
MDIEPSPPEIVAPVKGTMKTKQDALRADFRASMTASTLPDYSVDPNTVRRVGEVIGETADVEERKVRSSDSRGREEMSPDVHHSGGTNVWLWMVLLCTPVCTVVLLGVLAYWRFG